MKKFDIKRVGNVITWNLYSNRSKLIATTIRYTLVLLGIMLFINYSSRGSQGEFTLSVGGNGVKTGFEAVTGIILFFSYAITMCSMFQGIKENSPRQTFLMLPASNLEKFCGSIIYAMITWVVIIAVGMVAADALHCIAELILYNHTTPMAGMTMTALNLVARAIGDLDTAWYEIPFIIISGIASFALSAAVFRKNPFAYSMLISLLIVIGIGIIFSHYVINNVDLFKNGFEITFFMDTKILRHLIFMAISVLEFWLAYKIFCRMQIKNTRFHNL